MGARIYKISGRGRKSGNCICIISGRGRKTVGASAPTAPIRWAPLKIPYTSRPRHRVLILAIILVYIVNTALQANIKRSGARKRKYLHANY